MNHLVPNLYREYEVIEKTSCDSRGSWEETNPSNKLQLSHSNKGFKQLQDNRGAEYDKNYKKSFNRDHIIYPSSKSMTAINITYTNADQLITMKKSELLEFFGWKKPHIIAICEVKPKIPR